MSRRVTADSRRVLTENLNSERVSPFVLTASSARIRGVVVDNTEIAFFAGKLGFVTELAQRKQRILKPLLQTELRRFLDSLFGVECRRVSDSMERVLCDLQSRRPPAQPRELRSSQTENICSELFKKDTKPPVLENQPGERDSPGTDTKEQFSKYLATCFDEIDAEMSLKTPDFLGALARADRGFEADFRRFGEFVQCALRDSSSNVVTLLIDSISTRLGQEMPRLDESIRSSLLRSRRLSVASFCSSFTRLFSLFLSGVVADLQLFLDSLLVNVFLERQSQITRCDDMVILSELKFVKDLQSLYGLIPFVLSKGLRHLKAASPRLVAACGDDAFELDIDSTDFVLLHSNLNAELAALIGQIELKLMRFDTFSLFLSPNVSGRFKRLRQEAIVPSLKGLLMDDLVGSVLTGIFQLSHAKSTRSLAEIETSFKKHFGKPVSAPNCRRHRPRPEHLPLQPVPSSRQT